MINGMPRILIVRLSAIGDVVRVLPALQTLRERYPNAQIDWAVESKAAGIVEGHSALDRMLVFERPANRVAAVKAFWAFCKSVRNGHYDMVVDFHGILKSGLIAALSRAPERYGFARPRSQELSGLFTNRKAKLPARDLNRTEENLILCERCLCPRRESSDAPIYVPYEIQDEIDAYYESTFDGGKRIVAIHAPVDRPEKRWPPQCYAEVTDALLADGRFDVLLTWGPGQAPMVDEVLQRARRNPVVAPETTDLKHLAWLLHRADLYLGGDTGPMHIAAAMGTSVVALFGGTNPAQHAPYQKPCKVLYCHETGLSPQERLRRITPEMVYEACVGLVAK